MSEIDTPQDHVRIDGKPYVALELFEAVNAHVLEQGIYCNQLIATLNEQGRVIRSIQTEKDRLQRENATLRTAVEDCRRTQQAMRTAVYGAAEGV